MRGARTCMVGVLAFLAGTAPAFAWGSKGHRMIGEIAVRNFPTAIPAFLRTPEAVRAIGELAREPDRSRGAGQPHDNDSDPGHFVDASDDGTVLGGPMLATLPTARSDYDMALTRAGSSEYKAGWLPYSLLDGWQQLVKDFVLWRADVAGAKFAQRAADKAWFTQDRKLREAIIIRDLGVWAHYVGDASQPLHVTLHYNGWGDFPNPENFTGAPDFHGRLESKFVDTNISAAQLASRLRPYRPCACAVRVRLTDFLMQTQVQVLPAYRLDQAGAFDSAAPEAKAFVIARLAEGAAQLRDLVVDAWTTSAEGTVGYPAIPLSDIEAGKADPLPLLRD